jgi:hypothetical protein
MDIRDKVVEIVYESKEGLFPLAIAEAVSKRYSGTRLNRYNPEYSGNGA